MTNDDINRSLHDHEHAPPGPHILPAPLNTKDVYLNGIAKWMPIDVDRLRRSIFMGTATNEQLGAAFRLWVIAWGETPAGSLPNDPCWLANAAKIDHQRWLTEADQVLHGWIACSDGRLYHPVICEIAKKRFEQLQGRQRGAALSRQRQKENRRKKRNSMRLAASISTTAGRAQ
jgi:Protein of unknown function (DUF1376)